MMEEYGEPVPAGCRMTLATSDENVLGYGIPYPGVPAKGALLVYATSQGDVWEVIDVQVMLTAGRSVSRRQGSPLTADVIVKPSEGIYARYPGNASEAG